MMYSCLHGQATQYLLDVCQPVSDVASRRHLRSAGRRLLNVPHQRRSTFARRAFSVGVELVAGLPERPGSQQRHVLQASKDVFVCSLLIYVQRIRAFTTMRYINLRFTYLLTYFHFCETTLNSYRFIHQSSPFKFAIHFLSVSH